MAFDGILVDIDDTLYPYRPCHKQGLEAMTALAAERTGISPERIGEAYALGRKSIHRELEGTAASHNRLLYIQRMYEHLGVNPAAFALESYHCYWETFLGAMEPFEGAEAFLASLEGRKKALVTDLTAHIQYRKIEKLGLSRHFSVLVTSEEAGIEKPHPYIFLLALNKLGVAPGRAAMVGDNYHKDVLGARALGMEAFWFNHGGGSREEEDPGVTEFHTFAQLKERFHG